jgi:hypothetical protein
MHCHGERTGIIMTLQTCVEECPGSVGHRMGARVLYTGVDTIEDRA